MTRSDYEKELRLRNPEFAERQRQNSAKWHAENKERVAQYHHEYQKNAGSRAHRKYRITRSEYDEYMSKPCGICGAPSKHLDHNHETGFIRGALCHRCNLGLGYHEGWYQEHSTEIHSWIDKEFT